MSGFDEHTPDSLKQLQIIGRAKYAPDPISVGLTGIGKALGYCSGAKPNELARRIGGYFISPNVIATNDVKSEDGYDTYKATYRLRRSKRKKDIGNVIIPNALKQAIADEAEIAKFEADINAEFKSRTFCAHKPIPELRLPHLYEGMGDGEEFAWLIAKINEGKANFWICRSERSVEGVFLNKKNAHNVEMIDVRLNLYEGDTGFVEGGTQNKRHFKLSPFEKVVGSGYTFHSHYPDEGLPLFGKEHYRRHKICLLVEGAGKAAKMHARLDSFDPHDMAYIRKLLGDDYDFEQIIVIGYTSGAGRTNSANIEWINEKKFDLVLIIADNDKSGLEAAKAIHKRITSENAVVDFSLSPPSFPFPLHWDLGDDWPHWGPNAADGTPNCLGPCLSELIAGVIDIMAPVGSDQWGAQAFIDAHGKEVRYTAATDTWNLFRNGTWVPDEKLEVSGLAQTFARRLSRQVATVDEKTVASQRYRAAILALSRELAPIAASVDQWDADPWMLNTPGGAIDLKTGEMRPQLHSDHFTKRTAVTPDDCCPTPLFDMVLKFATDGDAALTHYILKSMGSALVGAVLEQEAYFWVGEGRNGKGVLLHAFEEVLGDYYKSTASSTFIQSNSEKHLTSIASLKGARMISCSEFEEGKALNETRFKEFTGGDMITANLMRMDEIRFKIIGTLFFMMNRKPELRDVGRAMKSRVVVIPFPNQVPEGEEDSELGNKIKVEYPGILAKLIQSCLDWQKEGMKKNRPQQVIAASAEYMSQQDTIGNWIEDCCDKVPDHWERVSVLYHSWSRWCDETGEFAGKQTKFGERLKQKGYERLKISNGGHVGLKLKPPSSTQEAGRVIEKPKADAEKPTTSDDSKTPPAKVEGEDEGGGGPRTYDEVM